jgi:predicted metal-dependent hydrolase
MEETSIDRLVRSRRRSVSIEVMPDSSLVVRAPYGMGAREIEQFVRTKKRWIESKQEMMRKARENAADGKFREGGSVMFMGRKLAVTGADGLGAPEIHGDTLRVPAKMLPDEGRHAEKWLRKQAAEVIRERAMLLGWHTGLKFDSIRITGARTRWGSCHGDKLNFTYRLVMAPLEVIDYVVVHELVHIEIKNHSKTFWKRVEKIMPGYKRRRRWLRENGGALEG